MVNDFWTDGAAFAQLAGAGGALCGMIWALFRTRTTMLAAQCGAAGLFALHYLLIGADTGAAMNLLAALQAAAAIPLGRRPRFRLVYLLLLPAIAAGLVMTWNGGPSVAAAAATALLSLARYQIALLPFRCFMAVALPCWFVHNCWVMSVPGMMSDVVGMTINGVMLWRLLRADSAPPLRDG